MSLISTYCNGCKIFTDTNVIVCPHKESKGFYSGKGHVAADYPCLVKYFFDEEDAKKTFVTKKFYPKCPDCRRMKTNRKMSGYEIIREGHIACVCGDGYSFNEKFLFSVLEQTGLDFKFHWAPQFLKKISDSGATYYYDFFLPEFKIIIEADGGLGHGKRTFSGAVDVDGKLRDEKKDKEAYKHGYTVIRIDMETYSIEELKNAIICKLGNIINNWSVNWLEAYEMGLSNVVKKVCNEFVPSSTIISELAVKYRISKPTVRSYLKRGALVGWCDYDAEEMASLYRTTNAERASKTFSKSVYMWDTSGCYYGKFASAKAIERCSEELVGIKLDAKKVSGVCNGDTTNHRGFVFSLCSTFPTLGTGRKYKNYRRKIIQCSMDGIEIREFASPSEAEVILKLPKDSSRNIIKCACGKRNYAYGHIWKYKSEEEKN